MSEGAVARTEEMVAPRIRGRVDAIDGGMVFGWAYDEARPEDRLDVIVLYEGQEIGRTKADRPRADLQRIGIGEGAHAFAYALPDGIPEHAAGLTAIAISPSSGAEAVLDRPLRLDIGDDATAAELRRVADLLEVMLSRQQEIRLLQQSMVTALRTIHAAQRESRAAEDGEKDEALAASQRALAVVEDGQQALAARLEQIEVFQLRFDDVLKALDGRIAALSSSADRPLRRAVIALALFTCLVAGISIYAVALQRLWI